MIAPMSILSAVVSIIIASIGFCVLFYIINLRMDSLLYARDVNSIRKYFFDDSEDDLNRKLKTRVLPQTSSVPHYLDRTYFFPVVMTFAIFNTVYLFLGLVLFYVPIETIISASNFAGISELIWKQPISLVIPPVFLVLHLFVYWRLALHREHSYLRSYILGVDIDGVLNEHELQFCKILKKVAKKSLTPKQIEVIPVRENKKLKITRSDEKKVFNTPEYWLEMPTKRNSAYVMNELKSGFNLKIHVFSHRPWPSEKNGSQIFENWISEITTSYCASKLPIPKLLYNLNKFKLINKKGTNIFRKLILLRMKSKLPGVRLDPTKLMTKCWLLENGYNYNWLTIEKGSEDISDPQGKFHNRFYISRKKNIRFFVEDVDEKAAKLAYICDVVFLMKHKYNNKINLPNNVVPVSSWDEIYKQIRILS
ncbi:MAG: hypothetical protein ACOWW1_05475 [archaeon]